MIIAVPFFGSDPRFEKLLCCWFEEHAKSGTQVPAVVITDEQELPLTGFPVLRVDTSPFASVMRGHPFDRKGAIVAAASLILGRFLACDLDAFIQRDPEPFLEKCGPFDVVTTADPWKRQIPLYWQGDGQGIAMQRNAGVMWFGADACRRIMVANYVLAFERMGRDFAADDWREQLAWSALAAQMGLHELPKELNWSHVMHGRERAAIIHEHGDTKWRRIA